MSAALKITTPKASPKKAPKRSLEPNRLQRVNAGIIGVVVMSSLSAWLNGYANSQKAPNPWAGWVMGLVIPLIVLIIFKVATARYKPGASLKQNWFCLYMGLVGSGLLLLSVKHCADSISTITGSEWWLSVPMAIAIDMGLVGCEIDSVVEK